ncbi:APC family permease [Streptomyces fuscichromogenes]|uniref:APC family permease n=1 Tax=Streptomyces fuscichromogenes TaxID=1324013 RepID=UPI00382E766A
MKTESGHPGDSPQAAASSGDSRREAATSGDDNQLRKGVTPTWAVFGVALGVLAPASTLGLALGTVALTAGSMSWVTWLLTSVLVLGFGGGMAWLARRFTTTGGAYGLTAHTGNRSLAFLVLVAQVIAVCVAGPACVIGSAVYLQSWLDRIGLHGGRTAVLVVSTVVLTLVITFMCLREIHVSAKALLVIEFVTVGVIGLLFVIVLVRAPGGVIDHRQFQFRGVSLTTILTATAFSTYSMAGFDHSVTLGREARDPRRAISIAVLGSIVAVGVLYVVGSYVLVLGFRGLDFSATTAPLDTLADHNNVGWLGYIIDLGVAISFFGSALGIMAGTSRTLFTIAKDGLLPRRLARVSPVHRAPAAAVFALSAFYLVVGVGGCLLADGDTSYGVLGTFSGYWLVIDYGLCAIAAGIYALRRRSLAVGVTASALLGLAALLIVFYYSFHPFPAGVYGVVAWVFIAAVTATLVALVVLLATRANSLTRIGSADRAEL